MSDWIFLNKFRQTQASRTVPPHYISSESDGFNGLFRFLVFSKFVRCIASDGYDWQHVSVTIEYDKKPPSWSVMSRIKELFWEDGDWVVQFHPPKTEHVNFHENCLHLWRYTGKDFQQPTPHHLLVGPKPEEVQRLLNAR